MAFTSTKKHPKCIPLTKKVVKGGLKDRLYGGFYDPSHKAIRDVIDKSYVRILTSMALTILKGPSLQVAIAQYFYIRAFQNTEFVTSILPRILRSILVFGMSSVLFVGKIFKTISERFDTISRKNIVDMLNKYKNTDVKILYRHVWRTVSDENEIVPYNHPRLMRLFPLPIDLSFDKVSTKFDKMFLQRLKDGLTESIVLPLSEASLSEKKELINTIKPSFINSLFGSFGSVRKTFSRSI